MNSEQKNNTSENDITNYTMNSSVKYITSLTGKSTPSTLNRLVEDINDEYDVDTFTGRNYYEMFDMVNEEWKIHFDFDKKMEVTDRETFNKQEYYDKIMNKLNFIFDSEKKDWAISEDSRIVKDKNNKNIYKVSYHFVSVNKKTTYDYFFPKSKHINKMFKAEGIEFDTSIYRKGITRFRIVCCKKDNEMTSLLKPITYADDIKKHIIQNLYGCEDLYITDDKLTEIKNSISPSISIKDILSNFEIVSTTNKNGIKYHCVNGDCPFGGHHTSNNNYIIENDESLEHICHSEKCRNKIKVLYRRNDDYKLFSVDTFNSYAKLSSKKIKCNNKEITMKSNYFDRRKYFEKHYFYIRNNDSVYNIVYRKTSVGYYEREIVEVVKKGLDSLYYNEEVTKKEETEIVSKPFWKYYKEKDQHKNNFNMCEFIPTGEGEFADSNIYNLFNGFNYKTVLREDDEIVDDDLKDLAFLLSFLKENVCENDDMIYDYFMSNLAMIIQYPQFLNHIITLFYSSEEGTGKSSFLKFFSKVLGELYSFFGGIKDVTEKHSNCAVGRLINVIEELKSNRDSTELLKNYSQREKAPINEKNKIIFSINCFVRYFIASNLRNCISLKKGERRYFIVKFNKIKNKEVVDRMDKIYSNRKIIYLFGKYLMDYELIKEKLNRSWWEDNKPNTKTYKMFLNTDNLSTFMRDLYGRSGYFSDNMVYEDIQENHLKKNTVILSKSSLWGLYQKYMAENNNSKYVGKKLEFYNKIQEDHIHYITKKNPRNVVKYYIDLERLYRYLDLDEEEFVNKYSEDYVEPEDEDNDE